MTERLLIIVGLFLIGMVITQVLTAPITSASAQSRRLLRRRIAEFTNQGLQPEQLSLLRHSYLQDLKPFERWLEGWPILAPLRRLIDQAGLELPAYRILALCVAGTLGGLLITPLFNQTEFVIIGVTVALGLGPWVWLQRKKTQRLLQFEEALPDALSMLGRTLRAGLPLSQALQTVSQEMHGPVGKEFGIVFTELNYGGDLRSAFLGMLERMPSLAVMAMSVAIMIQRETGGNLAQSVDQLEGMMRERFRFQRHMRTLTASNRTSAWIVGSIPVLLAVVLELISPGHTSTIFTDPTGLKIFYFILGLQAVGLLWIRKLIRLDF
ncbi:MAG: hypothetical protein EOM92_17410 [Gammaproteobacteria bacterium]|nr:hypothetical protein [Gammaproteobacteria bacterium]